MNRGKALPAVLDDHPGSRFAARRHGAELAEWALGKADFAFGFKLFQDVGESQLRINVLFGRADFCNWFPAIGDEQRLAVADGAQVSSEAVFEFTAADPLHVATSLYIVATKAGAGNQRLSLIPGRTRPARVSCQVKYMRWMTVRVETTAMTQRTGPMRLKIPPMMSRTMRSGRSIKPTLHKGMRDSARARA